MTYDPVRTRKAAVFLSIWQHYNMDLSRSTRGVWWRRREEKEEDETRRVVPVMIILAPVGTFWWDGKTRRGLVFHSRLLRLFPAFTHSHMHTHTSAHWQSEAGACGSTPVTAACSQGGDASGVLVLEKLVCVGPELITFHLVRKWQE